MTKEALDAHLKKTKPPYVPPPTIPIEELERLAKLPTCPICKGKGYTTLEVLEEGAYHEVTCWSCHGTGAYDVERHYSVNHPNIQKRFVPEL